MNSDGLQIALLTGLLELSTEDQVLPGEFALLFGDAPMDDLPASDVYAGLLMRYISATRPGWAIPAVRGREVLIAYAPQTVIDCFSAARLLDSDGAAAEWWLAFENLVRSWDFENSALTGYAAEQVTFDYERVRLSRAGYPHLASQVTWVSRQSDAFGFDILSFLGAEYSGADRPAHDRLRIEVKGTVRAASGGARFFLTRHEWDTALSASAGTYLFYLWHNVGQTDCAPQGPIVFAPDVLAPRMPRDTSSDAAWTESRVAFESPSGRGPET